MTHVGRVIADWLPIVLLALGVFVLGKYAPEGHRQCVFDGGGVISAGQSAQTDDGNTWYCANGNLVLVSIGTP